MPIGIAGAMLIGSAVAGGTAVAGAKIQSNAAKNAQKAQQQGTDRALAVQQRANQPYMDVGAAAAQRLGQMGQNQQPYTQQFGGPGGSNGFQAFGGPQAGQQGPPQGSLAGLGRPPQGGPQGPPQGMQGPSQPGMAPQGQMGGGQMVKLQGPDGSVRDVPAHLAPPLIARGARRVG